MCQEGVAAVTNSYKIGSGLGNGQWAEVGRILRHHRKGLDFLEHTVSTDMNANNSAIEDSGGSEEHCRENTSSSRMAKSSGTDCWQKYECQRHYP